MKKLIGIVAAAAVSLVALSADGRAATGWRMFGSAVAYGRGTSSLGFGPDIDFTSTSQRSPATVRLVITDGARTQRTQVFWHIDCWDAQTFDSWRRSGNARILLPRTWTWDPPAWVDFCEVGASAYHFNDGVLKAVASARY
jgi:hypothetical protein